MKQAFKKIIEDKKYQTKSRELDKTWLSIYPLIKMQVRN